jgi:hypothetical protein
MIHFDALDEAPHNLPARMKIRLLQPIVHLRGKGFQASHNKTQLFLHLALRFEVLHLRFQMLQPGTHLHHARFKFLLVNQAIRITVDQTCQPSAQLTHLGLQTVGGLGWLVRVQALSIGLL